MQKQSLLETSGSSVESAKVICTADISLHQTNKVSKDGITSNITKSDSEVDDVNATGLPDVSHILRSKFNKLQNGFRKRRALSVHDSISNKDRNQQATFYVPTPTHLTTAGVNETEAVTRDMESVSIPATTALNKLPYLRPNYSKSPSECSSGRGTISPTEELDNDSSGSSHSCKSSHLKKYSCEEQIRSEKNPYWDQGYHSIEYSPENIPQRYNRFGGRCSSAMSQMRSIDDTSNLSLFKHQCSLPSSCEPVRKHSNLKCESRAPLAYPCVASSIASTCRKSLQIGSKYSDSSFNTYSRGIAYRSSDHSYSQRYQNQRTSVNRECKSSTCMSKPFANESNHKIMLTNPLVSTKNNSSNQNGSCMVTKQSHSPLCVDDSETSAAMSSHANICRLNISDPGTQNRRRPIILSDDDDEFDVAAILVSEPKTRSCRRWSQADTLAINSVRVSKSYSLYNSNHGDGFHIGERVSGNDFSKNMLPYAALQSMEPMSMPYNAGPPSAPLPPQPPREKVAVSKLRRRSARSVSPESRKRETDAREKRQQIAHNLQKYVEQRRRAFVGCKSHVDVSKLSENEFWRSEETSEKVSPNFYCI